jgi:hypothetical protein
MFYNRLQVLLGRSSAAGSTPRLLSASSLHSPGLRWGNKSTFSPLLCRIQISVADPDILADPYGTSDKGIRIRLRIQLRILVFSSVTFMIDDN